LFTILQSAGEFLAQRPARHAAGKGNEARPDTATRREAAAVARRLPRAVKPFSSGGVFVTIKACMPRIDPL